MKRLIYYIVLVMAVSTAGILNAAMISVSFDSNTTPIGMEPTDLAGAPEVRVGNWNNWVKNDPTVGDTETIVDEIGATVAGFTATLSSSAGISRWTSRDNLHDNDQELFSDVIDVYGATFTVAVSGIPYSVYDVYVYVRDDGATRGGSFAIGGTTYYVRGGVGSPLSDGTGYILSFDTTFGAGTDIVQGNYVCFTNLSGSNLVLDMAAINAGDTVMRNKVAGFQIVGKTVSPVVPAHGAVNVPIDQDLQWVVNNPGIAYIDLYFGTQNDPNLSAIPANKKLSMEPAATTTWDTGILAHNTTYYWRIDNYEPNTAPGATDFVKSNGGVWSFTTASPQASISAVSPAFSAVASGSTAVLTVTGVSITSYQWYKIGSPDVQLTNGTKYAGATTNTLTISDVQQADEGHYYCIGSNSLPSSASNRDSGSGRVMIKRLTSHYPFEVINIVDSNSVTPDIVGGFDAVLKQEGAAGLPVLADANNIAPSFGKYLLLDNADHATDPNGQYAQIPAGVVDYVDITISAWVYPKGGNEWQRVFDFGNGTTDYIFLSPDGSGTGVNMRFSARLNNGAEQQLNPSVWLQAGFWHQVQVTISGNTGRLYHNGELVSTNTGMTINPIDLGAVLNYIGKSQYPNDPELNGMVDDLKIYNYARTTEEVAQDYLAVRGGSVCNKELPALEYDLDSNCKVDLADFAVFAATWLDSNRINAQ